MKKGGYCDINHKKEYVYAKGKIPVLLVAHLDIVHKTIPKKILYDTKQQLLWCPTGIGGDDRCGVFAILKICEKFKPYVLFTTDEEIGGIGAKIFTNDVEELPVNFIIEIDRRGSEQAVFYDCGNKEFIDYITSFGFVEQFGSFSDISIISPAYDIASVNLSAGYYNEHSFVEYISMNDLYKTINHIKEILKDEKNHRFFDFQENLPYKYLDVSFNKWLWQDFHTLNKEDWLLEYGFDKPKTYIEAQKEVSKWYD